jgi:Flp pilus assembly protein CpaB
MDTAAAVGTAKRAVAARTWKRRRPHRARRLRVVATAGFAGVTVALLATETPDRPVATPSRFTAQALVNGLVAIPVRFADPGSAAYLRPGDRVDVLAADDSAAAEPPRSRSVPDALAAGPSPGDTTVATNVSVLETTAPAQRSTLPRSTDADAGLVFLAVDNATAERLARAAARERLSYALHPPQDH